MQSFKTRIGQSGRAGTLSFKIVACWDTFTFTHCHVTINQPMEFESRVRFNLNLDKNMVYFHVGYMFVL